MRKKTNMKQMTKIIDTKTIQTKKMIDIINMFYPSFNYSDEYWWCWKYDFTNNLPLTAITGRIFDDPNDSITCTDGYIIDKEKSIKINVEDLIKSYNRNIKIDNII
jgi:hypothetical protein